MTTIGPDRSEAPQGGQQGYLFDATVLDQRDVETLVTWTQRIRREFQDAFIEHAERLHCAGDLIELHREFGRMRERMVYFEREQRDLESAFRGLLGRREELIRGEVELARALREVLKQRLGSDWEDTLRDIVSQLDLPYRDRYSAPEPSTFSGNEKRGPDEEDEARYPGAVALGMNDWIEDAALDSGDLTEDLETW